MRACAAATASPATDTVELTHLAPRRPAGLSFRGRVGREDSDCGGGASLSLPWAARPSEDDLVSWALVSFQESWSEVYSSSAASIHLLRPEALGSVDQRVASAARQALKDVASGLFVHHDTASGCFKILVLVPEHTDEVYERIVAGEEKMISDLEGLDFSLDVRAHQGRPLEGLAPLHFRRIL